MQSIKSFEKMMKAKPIKVDENWNCLAGHQRRKALEELGYKSIPDDWVEVIDYFTEEEKKEFMIRDNIENGSWDYDFFENDYWVETDYENWLGKEAPYSSDVDLDDFFADNDDDTEKVKPNTITLEYSAEEYEKVIAAFDALDGSKEQIVYELLGL